MNRPALSSFVSAALVTLACSEAPSTPPSQVDQKVFNAPAAAAEHVPELPPLRLLPDDLATGVRATPPALLVAAELSPDQVNELEASLAIVRWPSRTAVRAHVEYEPREPGA